MLLRFTTRAIQLRHDGDLRTLATNILSGGISEVEEGQGDPAGSKIFVQAIEANQKESPKEYEAESEQSE